jgi:hypothetical protein
VQPTNLFWPSDRKLFRQRSRMRAFLPAIAAVLVVLLAMAFQSGGWS